MSENDPLIAQPQKETVGCQLKKVRESKNISLEKVVEDLKIRPRILRAIERSDYTELPDSATLAALVRSYANYLGLHGAAFADDYRDEAQGTDKKVDIDFPEMLPKSFKLSRTALLMSVVIVIVLFLYNISFYINKDPFVTDIDMQRLEDQNDPILDIVKNRPKPEEQTAEISLPEEKALENVVITEVSQEEEASEDNKSDQNKTDIEVVKPLTLKAENGDSWIQVKTSKNKVIYSAILKQGSSYQVPDQEGLKLKTGNAAALSVYLGDEKLNVFKNTKYVVRNLTLEREALLKLSAELSAENIAQGEE